MENEYSRFTFVYYSYHVIFFLSNHIYFIHIYYYIYEVIFLVLLKSNIYPIFSIYNYIKNSRYRFFINDKINPFSKRLIPRIRRIEFFFSTGKTIVKTVKSFSTPCTSIQMRTIQFRIST